MAISNTQRQESNRASDGQGGEEASKENSQVKNKSEIQLPKVVGSSIDLTMKYFFQFLTFCITLVVSLFLTGVWLLGFVIAKGFWSTFFCWIPFYSWYLVLEHFVIKYGLL